VITNKTNLHPILYQAILDQQTTYSETHTQESDISVTQLISPPRMVALQEQHKDEIVEDAADLIPAFLGSALHGALESAAFYSEDGKRFSAENRVYDCIDDWTISGMYDLLDNETHTLWDYKLCSVWEYMGDPKKEWVQQLNVLRFICNGTGREVNNLKILAVYRDWSRNRALNGGDYPPSQVQEVEIPMWPIEETEEYIKERVRLHKDARINLPRCTAEDRWERPTKWAVMKTGRKSAIKLHDDEETAAIHIENIDKPGHYIQERPGESVRCGYCRVAEFCEQRKEYE